MSDYFNVTTNVGDAAIATAIANNSKLNITHIAFGDGNGSVPTPTKTRTSLVREVHRQAVTKYAIHPTIANYIVIETIIPSNIGGFWIREMGIIADNVLISHGSHAPFFKVADPDGVSEYRLKFTQNVRDGNVVEISLDESLIYASQAWVNENYIRRNELVDNLTTDDAKKPVSAKQAKNLQDNKLDKTANAVSATKLKNARKINNVDFDGSDDINIEAPLRLVGHITTLEQLNAAVVDGKYTVAGLIIAGLYGYGVLVVLSDGGVCHQTYYPHLGSDSGALSPNNGTMAMRQAWNDAWSGWRVVGTRDDSKLPLAGGALSGKLTTKPSVLAQGLSDLGTGQTAPLHVPNLTIPFDTPGYIPFIHGSMQTDYHGYITNLSIGGYRGSNTWENSGAYIAVGGSDAAPTEAFMFLNGRKISNTAGPIDLIGNASSANKFAIPRNVFGQTFDGSSDIGGAVTASTGLVQTDSFHYIDMGRNGLDRMNFYNFGATFNFIDSQNGNVVARITQNGIDCNAASATNCGRSVVAGNGLSGGGELNANRTVTLGTPSTVTASTANITTSTSHTHNLDVNSLPLLGVGQTWQKPSRSLGVTYTNNTGKPIQVFICANLDVGSFNVSGVVMDINDGSTYCFVNCVIPDGATYSLRSIYGGASIVSWAELR